MRVYTPYNMKKFLTIFGILILFVIALGMLFLIGKEIQPFTEELQKEVIITPSRLSEKSPVENFQPQELKQDNSGRVLSVPENIDSISSPEERTFVY